MQTTRLLLEPLRVEHTLEMARLLDDGSLHRFTGGVPATLAELRDRYARQVAGRSPDGRQRWLNWIVRQRSSGAAAGFVQATITGEAQCTAELAWTIGTAFQRQGYAREAAAEVLAWLRVRGVRVFVARIHPEHDASIGVARALGLVATDEVIDGEIRWVCGAIR